jgi:WD40 repeat protein
VLLWDVATGKLQRVLRGHVGGVPRLAFSPDGKLLATAGYDDRSVRLWDVATGWQLREIPQDDKVHGVAFSPDGRYLAIGTNSKRHVWDLTKEQVSYTLPGGAWQVAFRPDNLVLASGGHEPGLKLWDVATKPESERVLPLFKSSPIHCVAFTPEGRYLATGNPDGTVYVLRLAERGVAAGR